MVMYDFATKKKGGGLFVLGDEKIKQIFYNNIFFFNYFKSIPPWKWDQLTLQQTYQTDRQTMGYEKRLCSQIAWTDWSSFNHKL